MKKKSEAVDEIFWEGKNLHVTFISGRHVKYRGAKIISANLPPVFKMAKSSLIPIKVSKIKPYYSKLLRKLCEPKRKKK